MVSEEVFNEILHRVMINRLDEDYADEANQKGWVIKGKAYFLDGKEFQELIQLAGLKRRKP